MRLVLLGTLALAGCGGAKTGAKTEPTTTSKRSPGSVAFCLNSASFLVEASADSLSGSSPLGVNFKLTFFSQVKDATAYEQKHPGTTAVELPGTVSSVVLDDSGNPPERSGGPPRTLADVDVRSIFACVLRG